MRDGQAHFDVHSAFSGLAPTLPPAISLNPNAPWWESFALQSVRQYRILFSEKFGAPPALQSLSKSPVFTVVYGTAPTFPTSPSVILHSLAIAKVLSPVQPDYAYLYVSAHFESAYFEISLRFSDGTTYLYLPYNPLIQSIELRPNQVYIFRTGFEQLGLHKLNFPRKKIVAYEWRILNDNTVSNPTGAPTTEIAQINYQLDWGYDGADIFLLCNNGSGGMETIRLRGAIREKYTVEMTEIENIDGSKDSFGEELTTTYEVTTAFMRTDLARHYRLLLTGQLWLCNIKKHVFIRVIRVTKEIEINPNSPFNALKFSFAIAAKEI